ncbi:hypothetical protein L6R52_08295 [Myxococcota bacterium]|nr:hypothetical protein [Myxococcota bacterium]
MTFDRARISENPFYVLGLRPSATRAELEREGQKLLGMLELGLDGAKEYVTPLGTFPRTAELVRTALAELRDPERRLVHEIWACLEPELVVELEDTPSDEGPRFTWPDARAALGWDAR